MLFADFSAYVENAFDFFFFLRSCRGFSVPCYIPTAAPELKVSANTIARKSGIGIDLQIARNSTLVRYDILRRATVGLDECVC
jgi:hypothetical protein